jgi:hypothetical protein
MASAGGDNMDLDGVEDEDLQMALMMSMQQVSGIGGRASGSWVESRKSLLITSSAARRRSNPARRRPRRLQVRLAARLGARVAPEAAARD